jgi:hypothetical protein
MKTIETAGVGRGVLIVATGEAFPAAVAVSVDHPSGLDCLFGRPLFERRRIFKVAGQAAAALPRDSLTLTIAKDT